MSSFKWIDDKHLEGMLKGNKKAKYTRKVISIDEIDWKKSEFNGGRPAERIDEDLVAKYGVAMLDGDQFPAIAVYLNANKKYTILSGNHRGRAAKEAGATELDVYVVDTDDTFILTFLPSQLNALNGKSLTFDEQAVMAARMVDGFGINRRDAAHAYRIHYEKFCKWMQARDMAKMLNENGVDSSKLSQQQVLKINAARCSPSVKIKLAKLVIEHPKEASQMGAVIEAVNAAMDENQAVRVIAEKESELADSRIRTRTKPKSAKRANFFRLITSLINLIVGSKVKRPEHLQITDHEDLTKAKDECAKLVSLLVDVFDYTGDHHNGTTAEPAINGKGAAGGRRLARVR